MGIGANCLPQCPAEILALTLTLGSECILISTTMHFADFNATEEFAEAHWVEVFGGNGGYAGSFRLNPAYQVLGTHRSSL